MEDLILRLFVKAQDQVGQALAEYGLILAFVAAVSIIVLGVLGFAIRDKFQVIVDAFSTAG